MKRILSILLWLLLCGGCATVTSGHLNADTRDAGVKVVPDLAREFEITPVVAFRNSPPPAHATSPDAGATFVYARVGSQNSRLAPVDIEIAVRSKRTMDPSTLSEKLMAIYRAVYGWSPEHWKKALEERSDRDEVIRTKSNFFWESLSQHVAERVFAEFITPPMYLYGPSCITETGELRCALDGLSEIDEVRVKTTIDGRRDPLNPQTRSIVYVARRGQLRHPDVYLELHVPTGLKVAGPEQEHLDLRPTVGGSRETIRAMRVLAHLPANARSRTMNADYADYNLLFVPLRHLVFQGDVEDPKGPAVSLSYSDIEALRQRFDNVIRGLRTIETARVIAEELRPFITSTYYYMFDDGEGVDGYRDYILGAEGIAGSISPDIGAVQLVVEH
jgi:hypothetical protein